MPALTHRTPILPVVVLAALLVACGSREGEPAPARPADALPSATVPEPTNRPEIAPPASPTASPAPVTPTEPLPEPTEGPPVADPAGAACTVGIGLNRETEPLLTTYAARKGMVMAASPELALRHFPRLDGWFRVLGAPSLEMLRQKGTRAAEDGLPYEAVAYGLETGPGTPDAEWQDPVTAAGEAAAIAASLEKQLVLGPGFRLMTRNTAAYGPMAATADVWMLQTQQLQKSPPGAEYRREVEQIVSLIRGANADAQIWAQITLPPDREPDAVEWLAYHAAISDLVDGVYIGVYTWDRSDSEHLLEVVVEIFERVCPGSESGAGSGVENGSAGGGLQRSAAARVERSGRAQ